VRLGVPDNDELSVCKIKGQERAYLAVIRLVGFLQRHLFKKSMANLDRKEGYSS
jgi:hypothetical protein